MKISPHLSNEQFLICSVTIRTKLQSLHCVYFLVSRPFYKKVQWRVLKHCYWCNFHPLPISRNRLLILLIKSLILTMSFIKYPIKPNTVNSILNWEYCMYNSFVRKWVGRISNDNQQHDMLWLNTAHYLSSIFCIFVVSKYSQSKNCVFCISALQSGHCFWDSAGYLMSNFSPNLKIIIIVVSLPCTQFSSKYEQLRH